MKHILSTFLFATVVTACTHEEPRVADVARAVCPPPNLFEHAVCVCEDLEQIGELRVKPGPAGIGSIAVNGRTTLVSDADVAGSWIAWGGFSGVGVSIGESLITPASVEIVGDASIKDDLVVGGDLTAVGTLSVGTLELGGSEHVTGTATIANRAPYAGAGVEPCACDKSSFFDVKTAVLAAKQANDGTPSWDHVGEAELRLTTGSYYITSAQVVGSTRFIIDGNVSVFVDGDVTAVGSTQWQVGASSSLDLFVSGNVEHVGSLVAGDAATPGAFRLYVGGDDTTRVDTVGEVAFFGQLYAPRAAVSYVGDARIVGSIFARTIEAVGTFTIEYGEPISTPQSCEQPPSPDQQPVLL
jgi:hypothetical protein